MGALRHLCEGSLRSAVKCLSVLICCAVSPAPRRAPAAQASEQPGEPGHRQSQKGPPEGAQPQVSLSLAPGQTSHSRFLVPPCFASRFPHQQCPLLPISVLREDVMMFSSPPFWARVRLSLLRGSAPAPRSPAQTSWGPESLSLDLPLALSDNELGAQTLPGQEAGAGGRGGRAALWSLPRTEVCPRPGLATGPSQGSRRRRQPSPSQALLVPPTTAAPSPSLPPGLAHASHQRAHTRTGACTCSHTYDAATHTCTHSCTYHGTYTPPRGTCTRTQYMLMHTHTPSLPHSPTHAHTQTLTLTHSYTHRQFSPTLRKQWEIVTNALSPV